MKDRLLKPLFSAMLSGILIGCGCLVYMSVPNNVVGSFLFSFGLILICNFTVLITISYEKVSFLAETIIAISSLIIILATCLIACYIDNKSGYFECNNCKKRFVPTYASYVMGMHTITRRHLKCPHCKQVTWCKKRLSK
jgi:hypothetical protein